MSVTTQAIKTNLRTIRNSKGVSRVELSKLSGIPLRTLENIESDKTSTDPRLSTIIKIADTLGITLDELCR